jgi:HK97 family phage major capsid protein
VAADEGGLAVGVFERALALWAHLLPEANGLAGVAVLSAVVANLGGTGANAVTEIDVLRSAVMDLRQGPAFAVADLIVLNVMDWDMIQKLKNTLGSYILSADTPNQIGNVDNIFGVRVVSTTKMPQGKAIVLDSRIACLAWTRMGMEILANPFDTYSWQSNAWSFRGEERIAIGVQYPKAISIVSGLNPSVGS